MHCTPAMAPIEYMDARYLWRKGFWSSISAAPSGAYCIYCLNTITMERRVQYLAMVVQSIFAPKLSTSITTILHLTILARPSLFTLMMCWTHLGLPGYPRFTALIPSLNTNPLRCHWSLSTEYYLMDCNGVIELDEYQILQCKKISRLYVNSFNEVVGKCRRKRKNMLQSDKLRLLQAPHG